MGSPSSRLGTEDQSPARVDESQRCHIFPLSWPSGLRRGAAFHVSSSLFLYPGETVLKRYTRAVFNLLGAYQREPGGDDERPRPAGSIGESESEKGMEGEAGPLLCSSPSPTLPITLRESAGGALDAARDPVPGTHSASAHNHRRWKALGAA